MFGPTIRRSLCLGLIIALPGLALAQEDKPVARIDGVTITEADVAIAAEDLADKLPPNISEAQKREYVIGFLTDLKLGAQAATAAKMAEAPDFQRRLTYYRDKVLMDAYLAREARKEVTPEASRKLYDDTVKTLTPDEEAHARHILVETEQEAKKIAERVGKGKEDFAKVAAEVSKDPGSKTDGGDLGWFTKDRMVQKFAEAAFKLQPGQISEPVQTQFGWHVIKLEEKRAKPLPAYEAVKGEIEAHLARQGQQKVVLSLREKGKVERLDKPAEPKAGEPKPDEAKKP